MLLDDWKGEVLGLVLGQMKMWVLGLWAGFESVGSPRAGRLGPGHFGT